jgi:phage FluMu protein gp41
MITEKGELVVGIEHEGKVHRAFTVRPQTVGDSVEVMEGPHADRAKKNDSFFGVALLACQIVSIGDIPRELITPDLVMDLTEIDYRELEKAREALASRLMSFRNETETP